MSEINSQSVSFAFVPEQQRLTNTLEFNNDLVAFTAFEQIRACFIPFPLPGKEEAKQAKLPKTFFPSRVVCNPIMHETL